MKLCVCMHCGTSYQTLGALVVHVWNYHYKTDPLIGTETVPYLVQINRFSVN